MKALALTLVFLGALAVFLAAGAPLSVALRLADARGRGVAYAEATGTIWRGAARDVYVAGQRVGDVEISIAPAALARGEVAASFSTRGPVRARGEARLGPRGASLRNASLAVDAHDLSRLDPEIAARGGEVFALVEEAVFDRRQTCLRAQGVVQTDVLARADGATAWRGPALEGAISCVDGELALSLTGAEAGTDVRVDARLGAHTGARIAADVATESPEVAAVLLYLGFTEGPDGFSYAHGSGGGAPS